MKTIQIVLALALVAGAGSVHAANCQNAAAGSRANKSQKQSKNVVDSSLEKKNQPAPESSTTT